MTCNKLALIIPLHPKDFHYIYNIKNKLTMNKFLDIYFIFSNKDDFDQFQYKNDFNFIIIDNTNTNNIVTYKKWFSLNQLADKYDYYIVCDSEIDIIIENFTLNNILNKINYIFENKCIYAGQIMNNDTLTNITKTSCDIFKSCQDIDKLKELTLNYNLYYWWSDIPVYKGSHVIDFFSKIKDYKNINWYHFDHKIYLNYLVLYHDFNFVNITPHINIYWSLESYNVNDVNYLEKLKNIKYSFSWVVPKLFIQYKDFFINNGTFLLYHLDR